MVTSAAISSDRVIWDAVGDGSAGIFVLCHLPFSGAAWCGIEVYVLLTAAVLHEVDEVIQHLTWWSLFSLSLFDAIIALDAAGNQPRMADMFVGSFRVLTYTVAIGVIASNMMALAFMVYQMSRAMLLQRDKQKSVTKMLMSMVEDEE